MKDDGAKREHMYVDEKEGNPGEPFEELVRSDKASIVAAIDRSIWLAAEALKT